MSDTDTEHCEYLYVHEDVVKQVTSEMPQDEILYDLAELFKVFGDSTRIKILYALFEAGAVRLRYGPASGSYADGRFPSAQSAEE